MAFLIQRNGQPRLQIAGEEVYFPLKIGNNWQTLRIGVLGSLEAVIGNNSYNSVLGLSICRGNKGFYDPAPDDCFAYILGPLPSATYPQLGNIDTTAQPYTLGFGGGGGSLIQKRANFSSATTSSSSNVFFVMDGGIPGTQSRTAWYVDFDRVTTPGSMRALLWGPVDGASARNNITNEAFAISMGTPSPANMGNPAGSTPMALVYTGTANVFDTVSLFSSITSNAVWNIAAVGVARFT